MECRGPCNDGSLNVVIQGTGTATHLRRYSHSADERFNSGTGELVGESLFTSATGAQLWGTYEGEVGPTSDPDVITYTETLTMTGGFLGASGELELDGQVNPATGD